jgi:DNA topoisomerase I
VLNQVIKTVSADLGNTPTVCRSSYIHPAIISDWEAGKFRRKWNKACTNKKLRGLSKEETATLNYI